MDCLSQSERKQREGLFVQHRSNFEVQPTFRGQVSLETGGRQEESSVRPAGVLGALSPAPHDFLVTTQQADQDGSISLSGHPGPVLPSSLSSPSTPVIYMEHLHSSLVSASVHHPESG